MNDKHWPFTRQADYDAFNANMKSDNRKWKDLAIQAWIEARSQVARQEGRTLIDVVAHKGKLVSIVLDGDRERFYGK